eukprot:tig00020800_g13733.t1
MLRTMELHAFALRALDRKNRGPMRANCLYELGCAYLLVGNNGRAKKALEEARACYARSVPLHFPPESPRMQSIARAIEEAEARAAGRPPRDFFGFASRRAPPGAFEFAPSSSGEAPPASSSAGGGYRSPFSDGSPVPSTPPETPPMGLAAGARA